MSIAPRSAAADVASSADNSTLANATADLRNGRPEAAQSALRKHLADHPADDRAAGLLADTLLRLGRVSDAEALLANFLARTPGATAVQQRYATVLFVRNKVPQGIAQLDELLLGDPDNLSYRRQRVDGYVGIGAHARALAEFEKLLERAPAESGLWLDHARLLRWAGRSEECIAAIKRTIATFPDLGEAWWNAASMKTFRFEPLEIDSLRAQLARPNLSFESRAQMHFALGKHLEDSGLFAESIAEIRAGNALIRSAIDYDADRTNTHVSNCRALFTREFFSERAGVGCDASGPIFVVGMPRSGSTLVEQILSSHPAIEGTAELRSLLHLAERISRKREGSNAEIRYPEVLRELDAGQFRALGEEFMERTRANRQLGRTFFIDKKPENFAHIGFIHLILPNAKIIDVRRHPLGCCFSCYKHYFHGKNFTFGLTDLGRYYRDYVELMAHFDQVLPGRIHRTFYEDLIGNPEREIRRMLDYVGLPFDEQCLRFYDNERLVQTWSAEQVRMPIFTDAVGHWRNYERWLGPLKTALGPVLEFYPGAPALEELRSATEDMSRTRDRHLWSELQLVRPTRPQVAGWQRS